MSVTANGGPVTWAVIGHSANVNVGGHGVLPSGGSTHVLVELTGPCTPGDSGKVYFSPGGKVGTVTFDCEPSNTNGRNV